MVEFKYDIAFSLLADDEALAEEIRLLLPDSVKVFFYPERQLELAAKDGVDEFSNVFARDSRTVAVLYRQGWGKTKWTRTEENAIKGRLWNEGPDFVTLVKLDDSATPAWFPVTRIWASFSRLREQGVAAVLQERVIANGGKAREETAVELAARVRQEQEANVRRRAFLASPEGVTVATGVAGALLDECERLAPGIGAQVTRVEGGIHRIIQFYAGGFSVNVCWENRFSNTLRTSALYVTEWSGRPDVGPHRFWGADESVELAKHAFDFDQPSPEDSAWRDCKTGRLFSSVQLADWVAKLLLKRVREKIRQRDDDDH
jgi:hypothetical protein